MPAEISTVVATLLAPFAPYLVKAGGKFAEKAGEAAWGQAQELWRMVTGGREHASAITSATTLLATDTKSAAYRSALAEALRAELEKDPELDRRLRDFLQSNQRSQELLASKGGVIETSEQEMSKSGRQIQQATNGGAIRNARQKM